MEDSEQRVARRRAAERLLAWGFTPKSIAQQLHCSQSWVYALRRESGSALPGELHSVSLARLLGASEIQRVTGTDSPA